MRSFKSIAFIYYKFFHEIRNRKKCHEEHSYNIKDHGIGEHVVCTREKRNESKILIGRSQRKKLTGRRKCMGEDMILDFRRKKMEVVGVTLKKQSVSEMFPASYTCFPSRAKGQSIITYSIQILQQYETGINYEFIMKC